MRVKCHQNGIRLVCVCFRFHSLIRVVLILTCVYRVCSHHSLEQIGLNASGVRFWTNMFLWLSLSFFHSNRKKFISKCYQIARVLAAIWLYLMRANFCICFMNFQCFLHFACLSRAISRSLSRCSRFS